MAQAQTTPGTVAFAAASLNPLLPPACVAQAHQVRSEPPCPQSPRVSSNGEGGTVSSHTLESSPKASQDGVSQSGSLGSWEVVHRLPSGSVTPSSRGLRTPISGFVTPTEHAGDGTQEPCTGPNWIPEDSMELDALLSQNLELGCLWVAGIAMAGAALNGSDGSGAASPMRSKPGSAAGSGAGVTSALGASNAPPPMGGNSEPRMSLQNFLDEEVPRFPFSRMQRQTFRDMRVPV